MIEGIAVLLGSVLIVELLARNIHLDAKKKETVTSVVVGVNLFVVYLRRMLYGIFIGW
jgi:hypothetical protein